jgi:hypothetical protein
MRARPAGSAAASRLERAAGSQAGRRWGRCRPSGVPMGHGRSRRASARCGPVWLVMVGWWAEWRWAGTAAGGHVGIEAHDRTGPPCLPLHHHLSLRSPSGWPPPPCWLPASAATWWTTSPRSPTPATGAAGGTRWSACSASRSPPCWPAPSRWPRSPNGPRTRGPAMAALGVRRHLLTGVFRPPAEATCASGRAWARPRGTAGTLRAPHARRDGAASAGSAAGCACSTRSASQDRPASKTTRPRLERASWLV